MPEKDCLFCSGYRAEESSVRFDLGKRKIAVEAIVDRRLAPENRCFKENQSGQTSDLQVFVHWNTDP